MDGMIHSVLSTTANGILLLRRSGVFVMVLPILTLDTQPTRRVVFVVVVRSYSSDYSSSSNGKG